MPRVLNKYFAGDWLAECDRCGGTYLASKIQKEWTGFMVCSECFEHRHSLDFIRVRQDKVTVPFMSPEPADVFITVNYIDTGTTACTGLGRTGAADFGTSDCARADDALEGVL